MNRNAVFFGDADRLEFGRRLADLLERFDVTTLAYCLMGNHYHLLLRSPEGNLSAAMQHLAGVYTRHTNDRVGRDGPLLRGRFHAIPVETDEYLMWVSRYIHRNPIGSVDDRRMLEYRWSSYRAYLGLRPGPAFLDTEVVLAYFGGDPARLAAFTEAAADHPPITDIASLRTMVAFLIADDDIRHGVDDAGPQWLERTLLTLALELVTTGPLQQALSMYLGERSRDSAAKALARANKRRQCDPTVDRIVATLAAWLSPAFAA